jgi:hypothetical protein
MTTTTSRRAILAGAAALPALATSQALANFSNLTPDPIFAALDAYRRADAACVAVDGDMPDHLMGARDDAIDVLLRARPTTPDGLSAFTGWTREQADWLCRNGSTWAPSYLSKVAAAIDDATRGMTGLQPWSPPASIVTGNDPIFAAIDAARAAETVLAKEQEDENSPSMGGLKMLNAARPALARTVPTTPAGLAALTAFFREAQANLHGAGPYFEEAEDSEAFARSLDVAVRGMYGKAVRS